MAGILGAIGRVLGNTIGNAVKKSKSNSTSNKSKTSNEHIDYINNNYNGGFDAYYANQQQRYNDALRTNDSTLLQSLEDDSRRVGYTLTPGGGSYGGVYVGMQNPMFQQQPPMFDMDGFMNQFNEQNNLYMQQMQDFYNQQQQTFQDQLKQQEELKIKTDRNNAYQQQNKNNVTGIGQGALGGYSDYQSSQLKQGAHIKVNNNGQPGAISRYLAKDIWANK